MSVISTEKLDKLKKILLAGDACRLVELAEKAGQDGIIRGIQRTSEGSVPLDMSLLYLCLDSIDKFTEKQLGKDSLPTKVFRTRSALELWEKTPRIYRNRFPEVGDIIVWNYHKQGKPTQAGHVGIITDLPSRGKAIVAEGNVQSMNDPIKHKEQGFYLNERSLSGSEKMKILGYISPWKDV